MEGERVTVAVENGIADVRLNRPDKLNALDLAMIRGIYEAGERLRSEPSVRVVVVSGEGRAFCAGLDIASFMDGSLGGEVGSDGGNDGDARDRVGEGPLRGLLGRGDRITSYAQQVAWVWAELPMPVIAAVHGACLGGGLQIALGADIRIVAPDAQLSVLEIRWGLLPDMTGTFQLPRLVGLDVAKDLTFTGRTVTGTEAVGLGLATRVAGDPRAEALALAAELAGKNPAALRAAKALLNQSGTVSAHEQFVGESHAMLTLIGSPNQAEAVAAFFEKRPPNFAD